MSNEKQETIADIVCEMLRDCHQMHLDGTRCLDGDWVYTKGSVERLTVRIEAAHKREVDELRRLLKVAEDAISSRERAPTSEKSSQVGNAAAMRDALLNVKGLFDGRIMFKKAIREAHEAVNAAISAPPRNWMSERRRNRCSGLRYSAIARAWDIAGGEVAESAWPNGGSFPTRKEERSEEVTNGLQVSIHQKAGKDNLNEGVE